MAGRIVVAGVGMIPFRKPAEGTAYTVMGAQAARLALADARAGYESIQQAFASYVYGDSAAGQRVLYDLGLTGIPIFNVKNSCASGSTALYLARQAIASGEAEIALALGFEQLNPESPAAQFTAPEPMRRGGAHWRILASIRAKASRHGANNPLALFRQILAVEELMAEQTALAGAMLACQPACGAAAVVLCSEAFAKRHGLDSRVRIAAQAMATDGPGTSDCASREAARKVYEAAGIGAEDLDVVELHDRNAHDELLCYEALGLCPEGGALRFVDDGDNTYGGGYVVNPSGGLLSRGHPVGATGLAQCFELVRQLRGQADKRQVEGARIALQHNVGIGGAAVVTMYRN